MRKIFFARTWTALKALTICGIACFGSVVHADTIEVLTLPAAGNFANGSTFVVPVTTTSGATFDINYTITAGSSSLSTTVNPLVSNGADLGVSSVEDQGNLGQQITLEANVAETLSLGGLAISNFMDNGSGLAQSDITDLGFTSLVLDAIGNANDDLSISFDGGTANTLDLNPELVNTEVAFVFATRFGTPSAQTVLFGPDTASNTATSNRFSLADVGISFTVPNAVPEPSSVALLSLLTVIGLVRRKRS